MTDESIRPLMVATLRQRGYVLTSVTDNGVAGVDDKDVPIDLTWTEVADKVLTLLRTGYTNASDSE